jgi:hypothetical protein
MTPPGEYKYGLASGPTAIFLMKCRLPLLIRFVYSIGTIANARVSGVA